MPDVIAPAPSGRAKCRACTTAIAKGDLRFGEALPNAFAEGEMTVWFHLPCAACMRPEKLLASLDTTELELPDQPWLRKTAEVGLAHRRLPRLTRAERSPTSRATCRSCRETIDKGGFRLALSLFEDGRFTPIGFIHTACAQNYFDFSDIVDRIQRLSPGLSEADLTAIDRELKNPRPPLPPSDEAEREPDGEPKEPEK